jgi:protein-S-isoprenylcysteine O-methyltransferase Ste14
MRMSLKSTSTRVLVALPAIVLAEQAASRRRLHPAWLPVMAWGYAQYKLAGGYRLPRAGGPAGMSQGFPDSLVDTGVYAWTRNPMYVGHIVFATGLTLVTRSPIAAAVTGALIPWFRQRVARDEQRLAERFGDVYVDYTTRVPRWLPGTTPVPADRSSSDR